MDLTLDVFTYESMDGYQLFTYQPRHLSLYKPLDKPNPPFFALPNLRSPIMRKLVLSIMALDFLAMNTSPQEGGYVSQQARSPHHR
jgi:hypothetical protein